MYDAGGQLINQGLGAGTPDRIGFPDDAVSGDPAYEQHVEQDVYPFFWALAGAVLPFDWTTDDYLTYWPPNQGADSAGNTCAPNSGDSWIDGVLGHPDAEPFLNALYGPLPALSDALTRLEIDIDRALSVGDIEALEYLFNVDIYSFP